VTTPKDAKIKNNSGALANTLITLDFDNNLLLTDLFGSQGQNLLRIEQRLGVSIANRGNRVVVSGNPEDCAWAHRILTGLYARLENGAELSPGDVDGAIRMSAINADDGSKSDIADEQSSQKLAERFADKSGEPGEAGSGAGSSNAPVNGRKKKDSKKKNGDVAERVGGVSSIRTLRREILARSVNQGHYIDALKSSELVLGLGPAGTGKTYIAVAVAAAMLNDGVVDRIILSRPAVEAGESLGFLPGDMRDKVDPYLRPLYDALYDMLPGPQVNRSLETGEIEIAPLAFMRGRTLRNAFVILDEAQNATPMQMKMFLTRMGEDSRMVITGDPSQVDLPFGAKSGLKDALEILPDVKGVDIVEFGEEDVVRHDMVTRIVQAYNKRDSAQFQFDEARKSRRKANKSMPSTASASDADEMKAD